MQIFYLGHIFSTFCASKGMQQFESLKGAL